MAYTFDEVRHCQDRAQRRPCATSTRTSLALCHFDPHQRGLAAVQDNANVLFASAGWLAGGALLLESHFGSSAFGTRRRRDGRPCRLVRRREVPVKPMRLRTRFPSARVITTREADLFSLKYISGGEPLDAISTFRHCDVRIGGRGVVDVGPFWTTPLPIVDPC